MNTKEVLSAMVELAQREGLINERQAVKLARGAEIGAYDDDGPVGWIEAIALSSTALGRAVSIGRALEEVDAWPTGEWRALARLLAQASAMEVAAEIGRLRDASKRTKRASPRLR